MPPKGACILLAFLIGLGATTSSQAELIQFTFSGELEEVDGPIPAPWDQIVVGSPFAVSYIFDSEAEDQAGNIDLGIYDIMSLSVAIDGIALEAAMPNEIEVDLLSPVLHRYRVFFEGLPIGATGAIDLIDLDESFESDALPLTLDLDEFESAGFEIVGGTVGASFEIRAFITGFEAITVPAGPGLGALGLLLLPARRRRD